jgi:hypothetical protein
MKYLRRAGIVVAAVLALYALAWLAVPPLLKWQAERMASERLGRAVTLGRVEFRPWALQLTLHDLRIAGRDAADAPQLGVTRIHVDASLGSLLRVAPVVEALEIDGPKLRIARLAEGAYDIDDVLERFAPGPPAGESAGPARFALYNLRLDGGEVVFDDRPVARTHTVEALSVGVPFVSNLPAHVEVKVTPRLAFRLNGSAFDSGAEATPFAATRRGVMQLRVPDLDLAPYLAYLPGSLPLRVERGRASLDVAVTFAQPADAAPSIVLSGNASLRDSALALPDGRPFVSWRALDVPMANVQPLERRVRLGTVRLDAPALALARGADGKLVIPKLGQDRAPAGAAAKRPDESPRSARVPGESLGDAKSSGEPPGSTSPPGGSPWSIEAEAFELVAGTVAWRDASTAPPAELQLDGISVAVQRPAWPLKGVVPVKVGAQLQPDAAKFAAEGEASDRTARLAVRVEALTLALLAPYVAEVLQPKVEGTLSADARLEWDADPDALRIAIDRSSASGLRLVDGKTEVASLRELSLREANVDLNARRIEIGGATIVRPLLRLERARDATTNVERWLIARNEPASKGQAASAKPESNARGQAAPKARTKAASNARAQPASNPQAQDTSQSLAQAAPTSQAQAASKDASSPVAEAAPSPVEKDASSAAAKDAPWRVVAREFELQDGLVHLVDAVPAEPVRFDVSALKLAVHGLDSGAEGDAAPTRVELGARIAPGVAPGRPRERGVPPALLEWRGQVALAPLSARGALRLARFPLASLEPYIADRLKVDVLRADVGFRGNVALREVAKGYSAALSGDARLTELRVQTRPEPGGLATPEELLNWDALTLKGLRVDVAPPGKPRIEVAEAELNDFFSKLVITEQGRFNVLDVAPAGAAAEPPAAPEKQVDQDAKGSDAGQAAGSAQDGGDAGDRQDLPVDFVVGATRLVNGRVDFSDRFIQPNYSAQLTELNGRIGRLVSGSREMATLELQGRAAGTALLDIRGALNPTVDPLALDIQAKATDLELAPLSPYAGKYAGYAIERGKLSMDVAYRIEPDGKLDAKNQLILNQLTFGEKVESPDATKLPVLLAVALLKDRNGVIDINLPISGSINDPQFSVFGIVLKIIGNLLAKAVTAPFSLLAGSGGDDLSFVAFTPGSAIPTDDGRNVLDKVGKALGDRPELKMTVTGAADPASEREAVQRAALESRLLAERRREMLRGGAPSDAPVSMSAEDRARLLDDLYRRTDLPNKPRNVLGMQKDVPPAEKEAMLRATTVVSDESARELALQRGIAVRDALIAKGLSSDRLFLAAPKVRASGEGDASWTPRVQLLLSAK